MSSLLKLARSALSSRLIPALFLTLCLIFLALLVAQNFAIGSQPAHAANPAQPPTQVPTQAPAPTPDFSNVSDVLNGRRRMLPVDDLVITRGGAGATSVGSLTAQTISGTIGTVITYTLPGNPADPFATGVGRMFDLPNDIIVTLTNGYVTILDQNPKGGTIWTVPLNGAGAPNLDQFPMADFTGDGYADFAYILGNNIYVLTANDVTTVIAGVFFSGPGAAPFDLTNKWASLTTGDFDGNGTPEIALSAAQGKDVTTTIYTVQVTKAQGKVTAIALTAAGSRTFNQPNDIRGMRLVAGTYTSAANSATGLPLDDLALMYYYNDGKNRVNVQSLSVMTATATSPVAFDVFFGDNYLWQASDHEFIGLDLVSDRLDFFGPIDQVVAFAQETFGNNYSHLAVFTLDDNLKITKASETVVEEPANIRATIALGNFDQDTDAQKPIDLEIAVLKNTVFVDQLWLYRADPAKNFALNLQYKSDPVDIASGRATLKAGDTQGRSLLLGPPTKLTVQHTQPKIVLGMPPQHVDWVAPVGQITPTLFNFSAVPHGFYSTYQTTITDANQSSSQNTMSYSTSTSETVSGGYQFGNRDTTGAATTQFSFSAGQTFENSVSKTNDKYESYGFDASTQTGFDDQLWYNSERNNVYIYPVIGQVGCPTGKPNCSDAEKVPLNVMFSGPDMYAQYSVPASSAEWYQPVREPGNIFSYPWSFAQLQALEPTMHLLTSSSPTTFYTDGSVRVEQASWQGQTGQTSTAGSSQQYTWGSSVSVSYSPGIAGGALGGATLDYNGSVSLSTLNTSTTTMGESTGVGVTKPGSFANPGEYQYAISPYIFGQNPVTSTLHKISLGTDVQTSGILRAEFVADPTDPNAGAWWQSSAYTQPDVALNHPQRWQVSETTSGASTPNCLPIGPGTTVTDCAALSPRDPNIWLSEFHWMKGLLITPADANGEGPQLGQAIAGNSVRLQARVYNYSFADMPANSVVNVRFYGQQWETINNTIQPVGDAFLIDQVGLSPIPGFNSTTSGGTQPNWAVAQTTKLDTAAHSDQNLAFWVVVWMQDTNGNLVPEMPGHGLTAIPGALANVNAADPILENYSNNIGFYKSLFYIAAPSTEAASASAATAINTGAAPLPLRQVTLEQVTVQPKCARVGEKVTVSAVLRAGDAALDGVQTAFYDGDPDYGGKAFDVENVSHIRANGIHQVLVTFRATKPGAHILHLATWPEKATGQTKLNVNLTKPPFGSCALYFPWMNFNSQ